MTSALPTPRPLFEPTDLLGPLPLPTPPHVTDADSKDGDDVHMEEGHVRPGELRMESPPPDFEYEPSDLEDEVKALMKSEQRDKPSFTSSRILDFDEPPISLPQPPALTPGTSLIEYHGAKLMSSAASRITLTPPLDIDTARLDHLLNEPEPCFLPPLRAETASGSNISFKRRTKPKPPVEARGSAAAVGTSALLATPLHRLLAEVDELKSREKALQLQQRFDTEQRRMNGAIAGPSSTTMWVDKYRPKKFSDLLGEDRVHREVMNWLKEWDKCVFRRVVPGKKRRIDDRENIPIDPLGRPRERILLLSGPPGYGKTTLAHIVARHAGYRVLEINASDDRSAATVSTRIKNAVDAGTGIASEGRPTCIVIDEIDGAGGGGDTSFVRSLIKLIQDVPARRKSNTPARPLRRPIICICNDLYATSLRPLRPFARIVRFRKPQAQFLVGRLRDICDRETLSADLRVLTSLVEVTSGDVRSCLNTLQFIKSKSASVTDEAIKSSSVGLKDSGTTLQSVWNSLFIPIAAKQRRKTAGIDDGRYVNRLAFDVQACGDYDKVVQGCFEHYPNLKPLDASLHNVNRMHDWLAYYDRVSTQVNEEQDYELMAYLPYAVVPWHSHMAAPANNAKPTEWPKADFESYQTRIANEEVAKGLKTCIPPMLRSLFPTSTALTELIPLLMRIISPPLKPVNANIVKPAERAVLSRLVELMIALGLSFWLEKAENGQPMMRLEPPIDVFVQYDGKRAEDIAASRFAVRQLVAQAMGAETARRRGAAGAEGSTDTAQSLAGMYGVAKKGRAADDVSKTEAPASDFFGRRVTKIFAVSTRIDDDEVTQVLEQPKKRFRALYKFHEGSSSAVRKSVKMAALM